MNNESKDTMTKIRIISNAIAKNKIKKAALEQASRKISYLHTPVYTKVMNNIPCVVGPIALMDAHLLSSLSQSPDLAQNIFIGTLVAAAGVFRHVAVQTHKSAVKGAAKLGAELKEKGFSSAERKIVIKDHLSRESNLVFSKLFKLIYPKRVQKLAEGIETKSGFIG